MTPTSCWPHSPAKGWSACSPRSVSRVPFPGPAARTTTRWWNPANRLIKKELIYNNVYTSVEQLRSDVNRYVWWYNHQRLHSTLDYMSPVEFARQGKTL